MCNSIIDSEGIYVEGHDYVVVVLWVLHDCQASLGLEDMVGIYSIASRPF